MASTAAVRIEVDGQGRRVLTHPEAGSITREQLIERAKAMVPALRERAQRTEEACRLPPETVREFTDAGFFRIVQPRRYGGFELGIDVLEEVVVEVGRGCGSSAWCLAILGGHSWWSALFPEAGQDLLFGDDGHVIMATNLSGNGRCRRVQGGYELSGKFVYLSGCDVANWLCVGTMQEDSGLDDPPWFYMAIRPGETTILDDWHMLGLRGTGSKSVIADKVFVPECLALPQALIARQEAPGRYLHTNPLYAAPMLAFLSVETTGAAVGLALQAVEILDEIATSKPVRTRDAGVTPSTWSSVPSFRHRLAEAKSLADGAKVLLVNDARRLVASMQEYAPQSRKMPAEEIVEYGLSVSRLVDMCVQAVDHCFAAAGTSSTFLGRPLERCWRDMHMLSTHNVYRMDLMAERWSQAHFGLNP
ncbi:MAG TPA: acyl-CoA dehydrogenase family protein [Dehalococcoidia bacterium]|nr:acyl-CoA dehydrogenase family protein [Dehalococcoidia bacterium]